MATFYLKRLVKDKKGFTLIEILVAIAILSMIIVGLLGNFFSSPPKARDAKRKSSLKQIQNALELYYSDNGYYPQEVSNQISCDGTNAIAWGGDFTCDSEVYMKNLPLDPGNPSNPGDNDFYYQTETGTTSPQWYYLYARLENTDDQCFDSAQCCLDGASGGFDGSNCGGYDCNYVITSSNRSAGDISCP